MGCHNSSSRNYYSSCLCQAKQEPACYSLSMFPDGCDRSSLHITNATVAETAEPLHLQLTYRKGSLLLREGAADMECAFYENTFVGLATPLQEPPDDDTSLIWSLRTLDPSPSADDYFSSTPKHYRVQVRRASKRVFKKGLFGWTESTADRLKLKLPIESKGVQGCAIFAFTLSITARDARCIPIRDRNVRWTTQSRHSRWLMCQDFDRIVDIG